MRTRNIFIGVWLSEDESKRFNTHAEQCGLTQSTLMRMLMKGQVPKPAPPESFWLMLDEFYSIHNSFKTIADSGVSGSEIARKHQEEIADFILQLQAAVTLPKKVNGLPQNQRFCGKEENPQKR